MTEDELLAGLIDAARLGGWLVHHDRRSDLALTMGDVGFPDLVAVHKSRRSFLAWECKTARGEVTRGQAAWLSALAQAHVWPGGGWDVEPRPPARYSVRIVRPADYDELVRWLIGQ